MYDIIVIGGGHAGIEAALASARLNNKTLMLVGSIKMIGSMPCNPSIGGPAKGIIVREIDALGGEMAKAADKTMLQIKMLNGSKGPAVRALRCQSDKVKYPRYMQEVCLNTPNLTVREEIVVGIKCEDNKVNAVELENGEVISAKAVVIASGTYLDSRVLMGHWFKESGPDDQRTTSKLSQSLRSYGLELIRLKTGTPPRIQTDSIDFSKTSLAPGDNMPWRFSNQTKLEDLRPYEEQVPCYLTYTTAETHQIIRDNLEKSAMYSGLIEGVGPRYCPSIDDKVVRFSDKERHQLFLEPESLEIDETYLQGFSTSMPKDIQELMVHSIPGLENAVIRKYAYAIEYDAINPLELKANLETKKIENLFFGGQVNGTSGYEEAACQGLMAGINASRKIHNQEEFVLKRDEAYIGVLIDDIITKGVKDPYRLLTSRAEFRLLLRHDNSYDRLIKYGYEIGLVSQERYNEYLSREAKKDDVISQLKELKITPKQEVNAYLLEHGKDVINEKISGYDFIKRSNINFDDLYQVCNVTVDLDNEAKDELLTKIKYAGYIQKEYKLAERMRNMETMKIPEGFDYSLVGNLAHEAKEKLAKVRPASIGQASRISGVNPSDIAILIVYLEGSRKNG